MGAGAVGCFVGGKLVAHVEHVTFVGRRAHGITLTGLDEPTVAVPAVDMQTEATALAGCEVVLVAVKSGQTDAVGRELASLVPRAALVVSLQNGIRNAERLREAMPHHRVAGAIVEFNVVAEENDVFRRGTTGGLVVERVEHPAFDALVSALRAAGISVDIARDFRAKQWTKLVINLSNALGALCDRPTRAMLFDPALRAVLRSVVIEALDVLKAAKVPLARIGRLPVHVFPAMLGLPTPIFGLVAKAQLRVDPASRSSMWQDLSRGRVTEIEELNGEIVRLARSIGRRAPWNEHLVALVHAAEGKRPPGLAAAALRPPRA